MIRHADTLDRVRLRELAAALEQRTAPRRRQRPWVALTVARPGDDPRHGALLRLFPRTVEVPPLRLHAGDVPALVSFFLASSAAAALTCSPEAMRPLHAGRGRATPSSCSRCCARWSRHRRTGAIQPDDLPPGSAVSRRLLSPIEAMRARRGRAGARRRRRRQGRAARSLGMSRATIYRKIHDYGIVLTPR